MFNIFGSSKKEPLKIQGDFAQKVKNSLKVKLCSLCEKNMSSKVVFGEGVKPCLTCKNCELKAVGNSIQKLSEKNLITSDKFSNLLTAELIAYQTTQQDPPAEHRKNVQQSIQLTKKVKETSDLIKEELRILKDRTKQKLEQLTNESDKQNTVLIFQEVSKSLNEKRPLTTEQMNSMVKRSLVNGSGVHFVDEKAIETSNASINERYSHLKSQCKVKLKELNSLIDDINNMKI